MRSSSRGHLCPLKSVVREGRQAVAQAFRPEVFRVKTLSYCGTFFSLCVKAGVFAAVVFAAATASFAGVSEGRAVFEAKNCSGCHETAGPAKEKTIQGQLSQKGPELWYAGDKFKKAFLDSWLKDPKPIRPFKYNSLIEKNKEDHPRLSARDAPQVSEYLMTLVSGAVKPFGVEAREPQLGRIVFIKRYSCYGCHEVTSRGKNVGGLSGPSLVNAGDRLRLDWIYAYLSGSKRFKPVKGMPEYSGIMSDTEMREAASYIASMISSSQNPSEGGE